MGDYDRRYYSILESSRPGVKMVHLWAWTLDLEDGRVSRVAIHDVAAPLDDVLDSFGTVEDWLETYSELCFINDSEVVPASELSSFYGMWGPGEALDASTVSRDTPCGRYYWKSGMSRMERRPAAERAARRARAIEMSGPGTRSARRA